MTDASAETHRLRRWRMCLGVDDDDIELSPEERRIDTALTQLYDNRGSSRKGGLGGSAPRVTRWLGDIREFFPTPVVQALQKDAFQRLGIQRMLLEPEFLSAMEADIHLVADLMALNEVIPEETKETAREVVGTVVEELMQRLEQKTQEAIRGALDKSRRTSRPSFRDIDWHRTIAANLQHYQAEYNTVVPDRLIGYARKSRTLANLEEVVLCVDQSGSMATSVVYSSIFAAVMASLPGISTSMVAFDTSIFDMTEMLEDPVDVLFGVQLGGGTDIHQALAYSHGLVRQPAQSHFILISDLYEGGDANAMLAEAEAMVNAGINVIVLLALSDDGRPSYDAEHATALAGMGCPVFACTPDQFPDLMAVALQRGDVASWAAGEDIALIQSRG